MSSNSGFPNIFQPLFPPFSLSLGEDDLCWVSWSLSPCIYRQPWLKTHTMSFHTTHSSQTLSWESQPFRSLELVGLQLFSDERWLPLRPHLLAPWQRSSRRKKARQRWALPYVFFLCQRPLSYGDWHKIPKIVVSYICCFLELLSVGG